ncbi:MAG: DNA alkylation repair protein [Candidatus Heimdallarchaeota archaeon]|nr:DNA alkylation repair protein [Candidatus Heimdallarchaeota archaeon]
MDEQSLDINQILYKLKQLGEKKSVKKMAKYGIAPEKIFGVRIPLLRALAKEMGTNHTLAFKLWNRGYRETRILASMIADPQKFTQKQMETWVKDFDYWEICDQCCINLFEKTPFAYQKCFEYSNRKEEYVKRTAFVLMARLAVSDKKADDGKFIPFFQVIKREATDNRRMVKKAVNWALRQIGKRSISLNKQALETAKEILQIKTQSAQWIAKDAIKELASDAVQKRLEIKAQKNS